MIEFKDVAFQYEQGSSKGKIENINLTIHDGEVVLICGESGCGKTTLTRLINGLIPHYYEGTFTGQTIVEGIDVKNVSLYALSGVVGSVFQNPRTQFFTVDTTSEIAFGCENLAIDADEINSRIEKTVGALKIEDLLNRNLFALSGGEKQKIACASVSAMEPDIFVLDEPSSNLDIKSIRELKDVLRKWKAQGKTIVIAEHRLYYLMDIADRILYMQGGQIKENLSISDFKKKSTGELHALGLRTLQSEDFSKMQSTVCATKQLYIRDFEVSYKNASGGKKKRKVLDISDLMIPQGSVVGVVGNNGAGKTTFANNLCGLLKTAKGCMSMNGKTYMANQRIKTCYMVMQDVNHQLFTESVMDEILLSLDNSDEDIEKTVIDRCVHQIYQRYFDNPAPENMPILEDLYDALLKQDEKEAHHVATALEIYVKGSLKLFNNRTNVDIQNRLVCFDIKELGNQLKKIGMLIVQDQVWGRVTANRSAGKSTRYYIDEFHLLLKEEQTATYSVEIWKRFRKWGGLPTGITQNVKDLLRSPEIANILENSDFIYMLNQASDDRSILAQRLNISPHQLSYVTNSGEGEGLLFYGNVILPFIDRFPTDLELYRIMTTKLNEVAQEKEA